ncbi:glycine betaine ABC transporter substrate-binding protein [Paenibacillus apiarius]|uniref:Osmoprotectant ABC transporter substrate-binding protein n=1 Tax=Paenibacillus apiarius TaxID=46240 RepID=A0ABT4DUG4_9BACL|nr:glycine betaine ABC transporter substrate-binding protein [Paenibacillus apiarius]MCY9514493.1 osmoprotectant ABC transporter substrate-binding protein [Paenibacillus apiarius]MCY9520969.1 osmoprotectant ABC transporter substrate-binding protein [Paenibacillus apiarius]MCY9551816.1 osmoprotectant ABC transporter substrate-binding protein [Paenibacillus apiarius]MCY9557703.1 osmoprotectant ABC transporter substrate-binding protein [Paenibacillus apiarius]MCY9684390.1 osmoprotectant ABC trans
MKRWKRLAGMTSVMLAFMMLMSSCGFDNRIVIGAQTFSEAKILAEMYKALIEDRTDLKAKVLPDLAASPVVINAMKKNELQMATLYTGEIFNNHFPVKDTKDREEVLKQAKAGFDQYFGFKWYDPLGFENTYAFTIREDLAKDKGYQTISDTAKDAASLRLGVDTTWLERDTDGYRGFQNTYGFKFGQEFPMELSLVYAAVSNKQVDIVLAYSTDSRLKAFNLTTIKDDKQFFPPYDASTVVRKDLLEKYPELDEVIGLLIGKFDEKTMIDLNYQVDIEKKSEREVAVNYLKETGLLQK